MRAQIRTRFLCNSYNLEPESTHSYMNMWTKRGLNTVVYKHLFFCKE